MEGYSNFCSIRANACVYSGKWMFEVILGTGGIQQLGWATIDSRFSDIAGILFGAYLFTSDDHNAIQGVGDSADSYAYDGARIKKWTNGKAKAYGQHWLPGDVIGVCICLPRAEENYGAQGN